MGAVYLAEDTSLDRHVAIKVPFRYKYQTPAQANKCIAEARTVAALEHAAIVRVYAVGVDEAGWPFMVMEYLKGGSLAERLKHGPLPPRKAARILAVVADAVEFAHKNSFIHRDLKPGNILFDEAGKPRVADFGLAIRESDQGSQAKQTPGTPAYMSPEQFRGESAQDDVRIDVWALGVMLYEILIGQRPFRTRSDILDTKPKPPRDVDNSIPFELQRICLKCLARNIEDRYQTTRELATALHRFQARSRRTFLLGLAVAAVMLAVLGLPRLLRNSPVAKPKPVEPLHVNVEMGPPGNTVASQDLALYTGEPYVLRIEVNQEASLAIAQFACNEDGTRYELFDILSDENDNGTGIHSQEVSPEKPFSATFQTTPPPGTEAVFVLVAAHEKQLHGNADETRSVEPAPDCRIRYAWATPWTVLPVPSCGYYCHTGYHRRNNCDIVGTNSHE